MSDTKNLQTLRVSYSLTQGFWAKSEVDAVTVKIDTRPMTDQGPAKDARLYEAVHNAVKNRITSNRFRLVILNWHPVSSAIVLDSGEYQQQVKE